MTTNDKRPLLSYLKVQKQYEQRLLFTLRRTSSRINAQLKDLENRVGIGAAVRRDQLRMAQAEIQREIGALWRLMGSELEAARADAASAAVKTMFVYDDMLLRATMSAADRDYLMRSLVAQARGQVDVVQSRLLGYSRITLSDRVYKSQKLVSGQIDRLVDSALARGLSARELAAEVRSFIKPDVRGGVRYAAMRLGWTELNNAFHATAVRHSATMPWVTGVQWHLSGSHPRPDECNDYAAHNGDGVWEPKDVPPKPHPNCLCYTTSVTVERDEFISRYEAGEYDRYVDRMMAGETIRF